VMGFAVLDAFMISAWSERMTLRAGLFLERSAVLRSDWRRGRTIGSLAVEE
jgi:hypothetical protein